MASQATAETLGLKPIPEFDGVFDIWPRGDRLKAIRAAVEEFKRRFKEQGQVIAVRSIDLAAAPYLTKFAFHGAARALNPYISIKNRMVVVRYHDFEGRQRILVWEPSEPEGSAEAPFYTQMIEKTQSSRLYRFLEHFTYKQYTTPLEALRTAGVAPEDVDYISFDHLHVQDPRLILPHFPNAKLLVQWREVATLQSMHPMQWYWYVEGGLDGIPNERLVLLDGDVELGPGVAIVWTPGHTDGNHSLVINTPDGVWVSSENGVASDNWQPHLSRIPGVREYAVNMRREVCPNANTLEDSIDQYDSMVKEKTIADPSRRDPRWKQVLPSSELAPWRRQWPVVPTHVHGPLNYGPRE
ncbi:hypothetical protein [Thermoleophilum album]|uniref:N-acyl homoserine lactone hydrolase n=1 Tax=Thermoleophilum album TaxID=29539 RepID=A0A1H6FNW5_THEAL|nr:hypothetical protein [Thermoleophilum album]SEH12591.1 hypothetical protein SAMN02745716_1142 [Thermoleophilum album]